MTTKITMLLGSLDHTPSEQLSDDLTRWHTTALLMSEGGEHWRQLPQELASRMGLQGSLLKKWAGRKAAYKLNFERELQNCLNAYPIHVRVVSAQESTISDFFPTILTDIGISSSVRQVVSGAKRYLEFGSFTRLKQDGTGGPWTCKLPERQAIPLLFICHFLFRAHRDIMSMIQIEQPNIEWVDWQLMHNKFPGDVYGPMGSLFGAILAAATDAGLVAGTMRIGTFNDAQSDSGNLLADNIAGLFAEKIRSGHREIKLPDGRGQGSSLFWEIWGREEPVST